MPFNTHEWELFFIGFVVGAVVTFVFGVTMLVYSVRAVAANVRHRFPADVLNFEFQPEQKLYLYESEELPYWFRRL